ncbi:DUF938 domain-containing protein [Pseudoalteromonas sp. R3]|uniref:Putative SAM-dependent methytransferase n=1 Tax=Pseudoalteromonas sp. B3(2013) TaxID=1607662 RepID=A0A2D1CJK2_9GAMM|nr:DUF938 domain-containing protein [Pseudoalteromonas sp. R3]ATN38528.1 putative SAM-dependent methytransferase [Pseudoalteromonas sp. B3(2013)]AZZ96599.1 DUF938 domain-containing protein [Pseudoalteromonas sp. R3]
MDKPYSQACENNKLPILEKIRPYLTEVMFVLEVGSGTGQHAACFATALPHLTWQCSDLAVNHAGILMWSEDSDARNLPAPLTLDLASTPWPVAEVPAIYTANTLHIVSETLVQAFFDEVRQHLATGGLLMIYGPFNYNGQFTSPSNKDFDSFLRSRDPHSGIRNIEWICSLATQAELVLLEDYTMPANNRLLIFKRQ